MAEKIEHSDDPVDFGLLHDEFIVVYLYSLVVYESIIGDRNLVLNFDLTSFLNSFLPLFDAKKCLNVLFTVR